MSLTSMAVGRDPGAWAQHRVRSAQTMFSASHVLGRQSSGRSGALPMVILNMTAT